MNSLQMLKSNINLFVEIKIDQWAQVELVITNKAKPMS